MKKTYGSIIVQKSGKHGCGIVEMITQGCVLGYWEVRPVDSEPYPEFRAVHDRLTSMDFDREAFFDALTWGQKVAEVLL